MQLDFVGLCYFLLLLNRSYKIKSLSFCFRNTKMWLLKNLLFFVLTYICLTRAQSNIDDEEVMEIADSYTTTEDNENAQVIELLLNPLAENITNDIKKKLNDFPSLDNKTRESICDEIRLILESALAEQAECTTPTPPTTTISTTTSTTPSTTPSTTTPRPPPPATARPRADCGFKKKCVLFWECEESIISRRGKYEFDLKKLKSCKHTLETCCPVNKIVSLMQSSFGYYLIMISPSDKQQQNPLPDAWRYKL